MSNCQGVLVGLGIVALVGVAGFVTALTPVEAVQTREPGAWDTGLVVARTPTPASIVLFEDDFSTFSRRWRVEDSPKLMVAYDDEALRMLVSCPGVSVWSVPDFDVPLSNYSVEMTAQVKDGNQDSQFGFVLGYSGDEDFYALVVTPENFWRFLQRDGQEWIDRTPADTSMTTGLLAQVDDPRSEPILHLRVEVVEDTVSLYIAEQLAGSFPAPEQLDGQFGLVAIAETGFIDVSFDDVIVKHRSGDY
jgi:hypothetical protein